MSIDLPKSRSTFFPEIPSELGKNSALYQHLQALQEEMTKQVSGLFDNSAVLRDVLDSGVSGSFISSDGKTVTVTNGIITAIV
jgi:hypothetical protein